MLNLESLGNLSEVGLLIAVAGWVLVQVFQAIFLSRKATQEQRGDLVSRLIDNLIDSKNGHLLERMDQNHSDIMAQLVSLQNELSKLREEQEKAS